jgi:hypothetical protein
MRWNIPGATGILTLRCHRESNRWGPDLATAQQSDQPLHEPAPRTSTRHDRRLIIPETKITTGYLQI